MKWKILFMILIISAYAGPATAMSLPPDINSLIHDYYHKRFSIISLLDKATSDDFSAAVALLGNDEKKAPDESLLVVVPSDHPDRPLEMALSLDLDSSVRLYSFKTIDHKKFIGVADGKDFTVFRFSDDALVPVEKLSLAEVELLPNANAVEKIRGNHLITFCDLCDHIEDSDPKDIFVIPTEVRFEEGGFQSHCLLPERKVQNLKKIFALRAKKNKKRAFWDGKSYMAYLSKIQNEFNAALEK